MMPRTKPRTCPPEHEEQEAVINWANLMINRWPCLRWLYAIPNGGQRNVRVAMKLKAEGVKAGVSDLCLPFAAKGYHGLYIEMKAIDGRTSELQEEFIAYLLDHGYAVMVCKGAEAAIKVLQDYLEGSQYPAVHWLDMVKVSE